MMKLQYHLYSTPLPHITQPKSHLPIHAFFMSDSLREDLTRRNEDILQIVDPSYPDAQKIPLEVQSYHTLCPIESKRDAPSKLFGYRTLTYKAFNSMDGKPCA